MVWCIPPSPPTELGPLLDNDGTTHSKREDHTASIRVARCHSSNAVPAPAVRASAIPAMPFPQFAFSPPAVFIRVQGGHDLRHPLKSAALPPTRVGARGPPLAWLPASRMRPRVALGFPPRRVPCNPIGFVGKTLPCLPSRLRVDATGFPLPPARWRGGPLRIFFSAAAWRILAV